MAITMYVGLVAVTSSTYQYSAPQLGTESERRRLQTSHQPRHVILNQTVRYLSLTVVHTYMRKCRHKHLHTYDEAAHDAAVVGFTMTCLSQEHLHLRIQQSKGPAKDLAPIAAVH